MTLNWSHHLMPGFLSDMPWLLMSIKIERKKKEKRIKITDLKYKSILCSSLISSLPFLHTLFNFALSPMFREVVMGTAHAQWGGGTLIGDLAAWCCMESGCSEWL